MANLPEGLGWIYEVKLDGYRAQAIRSGRTVHLLLRNGKDLGRRFPGVVAALAALPKDSVVDGDLVALEETGKPNFSLIQNSASCKASFVFFTFDLLRFDGRDLTGEPLAVRRRLLEEHLASSQTLQLSEQFTVPAERMVRMVRVHALEGVVAKRLDSLHEPGLRLGCLDEAAREPQGQRDCKVEAHVYTHGSFLLSTRDDGPVGAGPCCFWQPRFAPAQPIAQR